MHDVEHVAQHLARQVGGDLLLAEGGVADEAGGGALELPDVGVDVLRQQPRDVVGELAPAVLALALEDGHAGLVAGLLDLRDQAPLEARHQALLERGDLLGRAVGGQDDLLSGVVERVEGVEELLLRALLVGQDVDVVHHQHVHVAVLVAEGGQVPVLERADEVIDEGLAGEVEDLEGRGAHQQRVAHRLQKVRLAQSHVAVEEERVVGLAGRLRDPHRGGVGEAVAGSDHEVVEPVLLVELDVGVPQEPRRGVAGALARGDREGRHRGAGRGPPGRGGVDDLLRRGILATVDDQLGGHLELELTGSAEHGLDRLFELGAVVGAQPVAGEGVLDRQAHDLGVRTGQGRAPEPGLELLPLDPRADGALELAPLSLEPSRAGSQRVLARRFALLGRHHPRLLHSEGPSLDLTEPLAERLSLYGLRRGRWVEGVPRPRAESSPRRPNGSPLSRSLNLPPRTTPESARRPAPLTPPRATAWVPWVDEGRDS